MIEAQSQLQLTRFRNRWMRYDWSSLTSLATSSWPDAAAELLFR